MSYQTVTDAGKELTALADEQMEKNEPKYGSADHHIGERGLDERIAYTQERIRTYLETLATGQGDPAILVPDCFNHLRMLWAKLKIEGRVGQDD